LSPAETKVPRIQETPNCTAISQDTDFYLHSKSRLLTLSVICL